MNILILSPGRRVDIVNYFKKEFNFNGGKVYTADMNKYAPALYFSDEHFIINKDFSNLDKYIDSIINLCKRNNIKCVISLIDPELELLSLNKAKLLDNGIIPIISDEEFILNTFDKYNFYSNYKNTLNLVPTYEDYDVVMNEINNNNIKFPLFAKIRNGSGSEGIGKINTMDDLLYYKNKSNYIFQPFSKNKEFGVDVYFDLKSNKIVSLFMKEKISMRSGETDKAISVYRKDILEQIMKLENIKGIKGTIDVDIFEDFDGKLYINEINPRFGGGYPHAYNCGINFMKLILNNLNNKENLVEIGNYKNNIAMMKYNGLFFKEF